MISSASLHRLSRLSTTTILPIQTRKPNKTTSKTKSLMISYNYHFHLRRHFTTKTKNNAKVDTTSTSSSKTNNTKRKKSFFEWYESYLQSSPIRTKMVTGAILWGLGDIVAQVIPSIMTDNKDNSNKPPKKNVLSNLLSNYDTARTARAVIFGFAIHAPTAHVHYNFLESLTVRLGIEGLYIPIFKAFMEQFVYWSWLSNGLYHGAMGAMQGMSLDQIYNRLIDVIWDTQKAQWVFWIPVQLVNFRYVPVRHQLNVVLLTSVVWTAFLSFAFPPVSVDDDKEKKISK